MMKAMLAGIHRKRWIKAMIVGALYSWVSDFVLHGLLLNGKYMATAQLWRSEAEMKARIGFMLFGQVLVGAVMATIFARGYEGKGWKEGARFGVWIGLLMTGPMCINYTVSPLPADIFWSWMVGGFVQSVLGGIVIAAAYAKK
jgi:hypothetical protein